jgi:hypothetical protein
MEEAKKRFRVVGISNGECLEAYAEEVEFTMNDLTSQGYDIQLRDEANGLLVVGTLASSQSSGTDSLPYTDLTALILLSKFEKATNMRVEDVEKNTADLVKGFSHAQLESVSNEIGGMAALHSDHECSAGQFYRAVANALKQAAQQNLQ